MLARVISAILPGMVYKPAEIHLMMDSQCIISTVEADDKQLGVWMVNRADEWLGHMQDWRKQGIVVPEIHHWPGTSNPADLGTRGMAVRWQVESGSDWQRGPAVLAFPRETWPASRDFRRQLPQEELLVQKRVLLAAGVREEVKIKAAMDWIMVKRRVELVMKSTNKLKKAERVLARVLQRQDVLKLKL